MQQHTVDWEAIHRRLAITAAAIVGERDHDPAQVQRVLKSRASLAARPPLKPDDTDRLDILAFSLAGEAYAVEITHVREVCPLRDLTALPCTPPFLAGVMNLRGTILAVVDLRKFFELPAKGLTELNRVIVLNNGKTELGLLADSIEGVRDVLISDLQERLPTLTGIRERFLKGITGQLMVVLDARRILEDDGLKIDDAATERDS